MEAPATQAPKVLLVEDDPRLVDLLTTLLTEEGYDVETPVTGTVACTADWCAATTWSCWTGGCPRWTAWICSAGCGGRA